MASLLLIWDFSSWCLQSLLGYYKLMKGSAAILRGYFILCNNVLDGINEAPVSGFYGGTHCMDRKSSFSELCGVQIVHNSISSLRFAFPRILWTAIAIIGFCFLLIRAEAFADDANKIGPDPQLYSKTVDRAIQFLAAHQQPDGSLERRSRHWSDGVGHFGSAAMRPLAG